MYRICPNSELKKMKEVINNTIFALFSGRSKFFWQFLLLLLPYGVAYGQLPSPTVSSSTTEVSVVDDVFSSSATISLPAGTGTATLTAEFTVDLGSFLGFTIAEPASGDFISSVTSTSSGFSITYPVNTAYSTRTATLTLTTEPSGAASITKTLTLTQARAACTGTCFEGNVELTSNTVTNAIKGYTRIEGNFTINGSTVTDAINAQLRDLSVQEITGNLVIGGGTISNPMLTQLDGFSSLVTIGGSITVSGNFMLGSLPNFLALRNVGSISISNPSLNMCCGLYHFVQDTPPEGYTRTGTVSISGGGSCASASAIAACPSHTVGVTTSTSGVTVDTDEAAAATISLPAGTGTEALTAALTIALSNGATGFTITEADPENFVSVASTSSSITITYAVNTVYAPRTATLTLTTEPSGAASITKTLTLTQARAACTGTCFEGNVELTSNTVTNAIKGYTRIEGNFTINGSTVTDAINAQLRDLSVQEITGNLVIGGGTISNPMLTQLDGFSLSSNYRRLYNCKW